MEWTRTFGYRLALAGLFDDPVALESLSQIDRLSIEGNPTHRVSQLMFVSWLAVQAQWTFNKEKSGAKVLVFENQEGSAITCEVTSSEGSSAISKVAMQANEVRVSVCRQTGSSHLQLLLEVPGHRVEQNAPADPNDTADLIAEQLSRGSKNSLFKKISPMFEELLASED